MLKETLHNDYLLEVNSLQNNMIPVIQNSTFPVFAIKPFSHRGRCSIYLRFAFQNPCQSSSF